MADKFWMVRRFCQGSPFQIVGFYSQENDAKRCVTELNESFNVQLNGQIYINTPQGPVPSGRTVMDIVRELGIKEIHHGTFEIEPKGGIVLAAPKLIVPK